LIDILHPIIGIVQFLSIQASQVTIRLQKMIVVKKENCFLIEKKEEEKINKKKNQAVYQIHV